MACPNLSPDAVNTKEAKVKAIDKQVRELRVAEAELKSLRPGRVVLQKKGGVFFVADRNTTRGGIVDKIAELGKARQELMQSERKMRGKRKGEEVVPIQKGKLPSGHVDSGKRRKVEGSVVIKARAPVSREVVGSNWQTLKKKIGANGSGPLKEAKRVNKREAIGVAVEAQELEMGVLAGGRRPGAMGDGVELSNVVSMDCEMVGVGLGGKASSLARVCIINNLGNVLLDVHVLQKEKVTDYRTHVSGIRPKDLKAENGALTIEEVQKQVHAIVKNRILVGHAIHNDLAALRLSHPHKLIRDTAKYTPLMRVVHNGARKPKPRALRKLAAEQLGFEIQSGEHSPVDDARCALYLYHKHRKEWEKSLRANRASNMQKSKDNNPNASLKKGVGRKKLS